MPKKYYKETDYPGYKPGGFKTQQEKIAYEEWRETHPMKPSGRPLVGKPTESSRAQASKYTAKTTKKK